MMRMIGKTLRRQLHTIISREIIKPSSPTPCHLQTYNLSELDQVAPHSYVPVILFYPNNANCSLTAQDKSRELKKSLSRSLTKYYPFAARLCTPETPYINCRDEGVVFVEAKNDSRLDKFQNFTENDQSVGQFFPDDMVWHNSPNNKRLVGVQVNHFACGGVVVSVSMSHKLGDACTLGSFVTYWASVSRYGSIHHQEVLPLTPHFIQSSGTKSHPLDTSVLNQRYFNHVSKRFVFSNSKLSELKNKMITESIIPVNDPTRVEVLTSLLYKTAVTAATPDSYSFKPSYLVMPVNIRKKFVPILPQTTVGNLVAFMTVKIRHSSETWLSMMVSEIQKAKKDIRPVKSVQEAVQNLESVLSRLRNEDYNNLAERSFWCSSICGFPYNKVDFGWGKASGATLMLGSGERTGFVLSDTPDGNGIQAEVVLEKQDMEIFENDKELLSFCQSN